jgi:hypothetical protein
MDLDYSVKGIVSYAPFGAEFAQPSELWLPIGDFPVEIRGDDGRTLPVQVLPREEIPLNGLGQVRHEPFPSWIFRRVLFLEQYKTPLGGGGGTHPGGAGLREKSPCV